MSGLDGFELSLKKAASIFCARNAMQRNALSVFVSKFLGYAWRIIVFI